MSRGFFFLDACRITLVILLSPEQGDFVFLAICESVGYFNTVQDMVRSFFERAFKHPSFLNLSSGLTLSWNESLKKTVYVTGAFRICCNKTFDS
jgi:hypothetical protein